MNVTYILYNPYAGGGQCKVAAESLGDSMPEKNTILTDMTSVNDYSAFFSGVDPSDEVILCGGDGTLNRFVNDTDGIAIPCDVLYHAAGSGNDFLRDMGKSAGCAPFSISEVIRDLPYIEVNSKRRRFVNGVGLGLDGYCCAEVARAKACGKKLSYVTVALRAFLKDFHPVRAEITVDGETGVYEHVWLVPVMKGKFFGGGVMAAPEQDRRRGTVTVLWMHNARRLTALLRFPSFMKGKHPKYKKMIGIVEGKTVHVKFDVPTDLQIDGEPMENVTEYTVEC